MHITNNTVAHTAGPWSIHPDQPNIVQAPGAGHFIADVFSGHRASQANTRLSAAAPDLVRELAYAERIILAMPNVMRTEQKVAAAEKLADLPMTGLTRYHERRAALTKAGIQG